MKFLCVQVVQSVGLRGGKVESCYQILDSQNHIFYLKFEINITVSDKRHGYYYSLTVLYTI